MALLVEDANENPFPDVVQFSQVPLEKYEEFDDYIASYREIIRYDEQDMNQKLLDYQAQYQNILKTVELLRLLTQAVYVLIGLFLFTMFIMVHMVIRNFIFFLQDEMRIIELVGGKPTFIYGPLAVQGVVYTIFAVLFSLLVFVIFKNTGAVNILPADLLSIFAKFYENLTQYIIWYQL